MSTTTKTKKIRVQLSARLEAPRYWEVQGWSYRRTLSGGEFISALPEEVPEDHPVAFRQVEILRPGTYNWWDFTAQEMAEISANFKADQPPPLQIDHSRSSSDCHGRVIDIYLDHELEGGPRVLGLVLFLGAHAVERVLDGRWSRYSAGLWLNPCILDELSVTNWPACQTAKNLHESEEEMEDDDEGKGAGLDAATPTQEPKKHAELATEPSQPSLEELKALRLENEKYKAENEQYKAEFSAQQKELIEARVRRDLIELVRSGQSTPALHELEVEFCLSLDDEKREAFIKLREAMKPVWKPGRETLPNLDRSVPDQVGVDKARLQRSLEGMVK